MTDITPLKNEFREVSAYSEVQDLAAQGYDQIMVTNVKGVFTHILVPSSLVSEDRVEKVSEFVKWYTETFTPDTSAVAPSSVVAPPVVDQQ
jgi:menaquinone-dependent protoporphyrinogen IX oxidase